MTDNTGFERFVADHLADDGSGAARAEQIASRIDDRTGERRQLPRWLALIKEPPMRSNSHLAVGSPTARVAAIVVATLLLALTIAGAGIAGSRLLAADGAIVVDQGGEGTVTTISEAVDMAEDGDTILVRPGTYDEAIVLDKDVTIRGDGDRDDVVVELSVELPPGDLTHNPPHVPTAFLIESADATLENLTLRGESSRIVINGGAPELRDLVFDGVGRVYLLDASAPSGLLIDHGSTALIEDSVMVDTDIGIRAGTSPTLIRNEITIGAIWIDGAGSPSTEPVIRENTIADSVKWGITIWEARPEIVGNTIVDAVNGIVVEDPGNAPTLRGNIISGSESTGISVINGADATIDGNVLTDNNIGISTSASDAALVGNTVSGGRDGITLTGGSPTLEANDIEGAERGLVIGSGTAPTLVGNTVCGNTTNLEINMPEGGETPDTSGNEICEDTPAE